MLQRRSKRCWGWGWDNQGADEGQIPRTPGSTCMCLLGSAHMYVLGKLPSHKMLEQR